MSYWAPKTNGVGEAINKRLTSNFKAWWVLTVSLLYLILAGRHVSVPMLLHMVLEPYWLNSSHPENGSQLLTSQDHWPPRRVVRLNWERGSGSHLSMWKVQRLFNWSFLSHRDWSQTPCAIIHLQVPGWTSCQSAMLLTSFDAFQLHSVPCTWKGPCSGRYSLKGTTFNCRHWRRRVSAKGGSLYQLDHTAVASLWI